MKGRILGWTQSPINSNSNRKRFWASMSSMRSLCHVNFLFYKCISTVDGETYEGEYSLSLREIKRSFKETRQLVKLCPKYLPIGQVKGCTENQLEFHLYLLESLGIVDFVLHVGDFFRHGDETMIRRARNYAKRIRRHYLLTVLDAKSDIPFPSHT